MATDEKAAEPVGTGPEADTAVWGKPWDIVEPFFDINPDDLDSEDPDAHLTAIQEAVQFLETVVSPRRGEAETDLGTMVDVMITKLQKALKEACFEQGEGNPLYGYEILRDAVHDTCAQLTRGADDYSALTPAEGEPVAQYQWRIKGGAWNNCGKSDAEFQDRGPATESRALYTRPAEGERAALEEIRDAVKVNTSYEDFVGYLQAIASNALASQPVATEERCDTTLTLRHPRDICTCDDETDLMGPCDTWEIGQNGRCIYCNHTEACHPASPERKEPATTEGDTEPKAKE